MEKVEWTSLKELIASKQIEFESKHFVWENQAESYIIATTWDKSKINFNEYKKNYLKEMRLRTKGKKMEEFK